MKYDWITSFLYTLIIVTCVCKPLILFDMMFLALNWMKLGVRPRNQPQIHSDTCCLRELLLLLILHTNPPQKVCCFPYVSRILLSFSSCHYSLSLQTHKTPILGCVEILSLNNHASLSYPATKSLWQRLVYINFLPS